jgi:hypothetical protein
MNQASRVDKSWRGAIDVNRADEDYVETSQQGLSRDDKNRAELTRTELSRANEA